MANPVVVTNEDIAKLQEFHRQHFPAQPVPDIPLTNTLDEPVPTENDSSTLGFYEDGTRRTLTDEQIAMFRHSEIQRLLAERRRQIEVQEERAAKEKRRRATKAQAQHTNSESSRFDNDATVHARGQDSELSYDEDTLQPSTKREKKFLWPVLGS